MSDEQIRNAERRAKAGDIEGALEYFRLAGKTEDLFLQYDALMTLAEAQNPGLMERFAQVNEMLEEARALLNSALDRHLDENGGSLFLSEMVSRKQVEHYARLVGMDPALPVEGLER